MRHEDYDFGLTDSGKEATGSVLSEQANNDGLKGQEILGKAKAALPSGFPSAESLLGDENTAGIQEDTLDFSKKEARDGGQLGSGDYATALGKDLGTAKFREAVKDLDHDTAMKTLEAMRESSSSGRLTESDLRQAYSKSDMSQKVAILYALSNFDSFAKAGNTFTADWTETALDKIDLDAAKEPGK